MAELMERCKVSWFNQTATYWASNGVDSIGDTTFAAPVALSLRWELRSEQFVDGNGRSLRSRAVLYLQQDVDIGDFLFLGTSTTVDPRTLTSAFEVQDFRKIPNGDATQFERRAMI